MEMSNLSKVIIIQSFYIYCVVSNKKYSMPGHWIIIF